MARKKKSSKPRKPVVEAEVEETPVEVKKSEPEVKSGGAEIAEAAGLSTPTPQVTDRQMRYRKNPVCPECGAHPTVTTSRDKGGSSHRCRICGFRWANVPLADD